MPTVTYTNGWYVIDRSGDESSTSRFEFQTQDGTTVYWDPRVGFYYYYTDDHGLRHRSKYESATFSSGVVIPRFTYAQPQALDVNPTCLWPRVSAGAVATSAQIDAMRWVRVLVLQSVSGGYIEIPLSDVDGKSFFDPGVPPAGFARRDSAGSDWVLIPRGGTWTDDAPYRRQNSSSTTFPAFNIEWGVYPRRDPRPHWVLRVLSLVNTSSANLRTVCVDLFGQHYEEHSAPTVALGSHGTDGHHKVELMWSGHPFDSAGDRTILNERILCRGAIHVANGSNGTIYLTTGANQGLSTGTNPFGADGDDLPAVIVFGNQTIGSDVTGAAKTTWEPETWGIGCQNAASAVSGSSKLYRSVLTWDSGVSRWKLVVYNELPAGGSSSGANDRTFFVYAFGRP